MRIATVLFNVCLHTDSGREYLRQNVKRHEDNCRMRHEETYRMRK